MEAKGQLHVPATYLLKKELLLSIELGAGWSPELIWMLLERKKNFAPARIQTIFSQSVIQILSIKLNYILYFV
jgi:hypothetical protein